MGVLGAIVVVVLALLVFVAAVAAVLAQILVLTSLVTMQASSVSTPDAASAVRHLLIAADGTATVICRRPRSGTHPDSTKIGGSHYTVHPGPRC